MSGRRQISEAIDQLADRLEADGQPPEELMARGRRRRWLRRAGTVAAVVVLLAGAVVAITAVWQQPRPPVVDAPRSVQLPTTSEPAEGLEPAAGILQAGPEGRPGCVSLQSPISEQTLTGAVEWPSGFAGRIENGRLLILDADGQVAAEQGQYVRLAGNRQPDRRLAGCGGDDDGVFAVNFVEHYRPPADSPDPPLSVLSDPAADLELPRRGPEGPQLDTARLATSAVGVDFYVARGDQQSICVVAVPRDDPQEWSSSCTGTDAEAPLRNGLAATLSASGRFSVTVVGDGLTTVDAPFEVVLENNVLVVPGGPPSGPVVLDGPAGRIVLRP